MGLDASRDKPLDFAPIVAQIADKMIIQEMLYYGGPREFFANFSPNHSMEVEAYYDSIIGAERPFPSSLVVSVDYLHGVGMLRIYDVLDELKRVTQGIGFFHVRTHHEIEDFKNIEKPFLWWMREFSKRFDVQTYQRVPEGFYVICYPRAN